jgi:hypothetical protein
MTYDQPPLEEMTLRQLRRVASRYGISRYSRMRKEQLLEAIQAIEQQSAPPAPSVPVPPAPVPISPEPIVVTDPFEVQEQVEATKFEVGVAASGYDPTLASVDVGLGDLPGGYGESRIVLLPRDPQWAFTYWDVSNEHKTELRNQGGQQIALRLCDATDINLNDQAPHSVQEYPCDELAREWYLPIPVSDRDYVIEIGYRTYDGRWLLLARSSPVRIPPTYPSDWIEDYFVTVDWNSDLRSKTVATLVPPTRKAAVGAGFMASETSAIYDQIFQMAQGTESLRVAGSLYGSMQQAPAESVTSYVFPSGAGLWALPTASGLFSASAAPAKPRSFWLVADAELIVYGATEPDATVTIGGKPIKLTPDGTFRYQMSFQDGVIDYPIVAVAADGEQNREIHMKFTRETLARRTNTKAEAIEEWFF